MDEAKKNQQQLNKWAVGLLENCNKLEIAFDEKPSVTLLKWSRQLADLANDTRPDLTKLLWHGFPRIPVEFHKRQSELVAQAEFTLNCLEANGYLRLTKIGLVNPWHEKSFQNVAIEFKDKWQQITRKNGDARKNGRKNGDGFIFSIVAAWVMRRQTISRGYRPLDPRERALVMSASVLKRSIFPRKRLLTRGWVTPSVAAAFF